MKILLTGASSFTGYWFARELSEAGHSVVATLRRGKDGYPATDVRGARVAQLAKFADIVWSCPFGEAEFLAVAEHGAFDVLCHHAACVTNYRSPDFDVAAALNENTKAMPTVLRALRDNGLKGMVLTGSVFEADEGAGNTPLRAFSPYGVSKGLTAQLVRYWCGELNIPLGKFVIPNPFGPYEEPRFCAFLLKTWREGAAADVRTPRYVRDNIHVDLLAKAYVQFTASVPGGPSYARFNPSGYVESQGTFAQRFAREIGPRLGLEARVNLLEQTDFSEPMTRINTDVLDASQLGCNETVSWDRVADFYRKNP